VVTPTDEAGLRAAISALEELKLAEVAGWTLAERAALVHLGRARLASGDWAAACGLLEYAVLLDPAAAGTWELVAGARMACRRWGEALVALEIAWSLERSWRRAALAALCCERQGEVVEAERWREAAWAMAPVDAEEHRRMERALEPADTVAS
jgi:tetratricopeptide (TPR) repeat protein